MRDPRVRTLPSRRSFLGGVAVAGIAGTAAPVLLHRALEAQDPWPGSVLKVVIIGEPPSAP